MSFFKDFKEDLSQAVNELVPGEDTTEAAEQDNDVVVNTLEDELDVESELSKLDGLLEKITKDANAPVEKEAPAQETETKVAPFSTKNSPKITNTTETTTEIIKENTKIAVSD